MSNLPLKAAELLFENVRSSLRHEQGSSQYWNDLPDEVHIVELERQRDHLQHLIVQYHDAKQYLAAVAEQPGF